MVPTKVLSEGQVEEIHGAAEEVLEEVGFRVMHEGLLGVARRAEARVEEDGTVKVPRELLEELLELVPGRYEVVGAGGRKWTVGGGERHCLAIVTDPWILDYDTGRLRRPCLADVVRHTRIAQMLERVVAISLMDYPVADFPGPTSSLHAMEEHIINHDKHIYVLPTSVESLERWLRVGRILLRGGELNGNRLMTVGVAVLSPLTLTEMNGEFLLIACHDDLPVVPTVCPMAGTTSPYSKAGTLVLAHAENLFLAALTQMVRPGHPFMYAMGPSRTDMRSGEDMYYTLDKVLWKVAGVQLGKFCGIPTTAECGGTMSPRYDVQAGAEGMLFMLSAYLSGADMLAGIGSYCNAVGMSGEMMLLQTAWLEAAEFLSRGWSWREGSGWRA